MIVRLQFENEQLRAKLKKSREENEQLHTVIANLHSQINQLKQGCKNEKVRKV